MLKIVAVIKRRPDITRERFLHEWQVAHPPIVRRMPGIRAYRQSPAIEHRTEWFADGMAELWFDSKDAIRDAFASTVGDEVRAHEDEFLERIDWFIADEGIDVPVTTTGEAA